ncbi:MAG TPA: ribulose-phosphate 3-epimerase [Kiritimatiellia bacterium]|nr:ribulose-phosphate 3-epimerase [Kiritimatiellia bacterium]HNR93674.1 ribulose-phosphate 3-epimerase [Kiritimatiellia bacterium]HNS80366.1 ribulose-phosphate 3-epimerase [Kiritimatiellia bacterium]HPA78088.1 ribulose-phosphate 3-epimerase [Kiritimatiellia bacterium]HQQ04330.1 ribulose-phosphate 3-epimerase [Kiritimatiellia bacterium]
MQKIEIFPSILACDMGHLADECRRSVEAGSDGLHVDIMDGIFVPNISMGFDIIRVVDRIVDIPLSVHLMIVKPDPYVEKCVELGADTVLIHIESEGDIRGALRKIRAKGARAGITINPETPASAIDGVLDEIDEILIMSVHPGFGGQSFIAEVLNKVKILRRRLPGMDISIDGGIDTETAGRSAACGANIFLAGSSLYRANDMAAEIRAMRDNATKHFNTGLNS